MSGRRHVGWLVSLYRMGLLLLPARFRHGFGDDMVQLFRDQLRDAGTHQGSPRVWRVALKAYLDLGRQAVLEHLERSPAPRGAAGKGGGTVERTFRETLLAARSLARRPLLTGTIVGIMALGIGLDTALYSALRATLVRPLPFSDAEEIMVLTGSYAGATRWSLGVPELRDLEARLPELGPIGIYSTGWSIGQTGDGLPVQLEGGVASSAFFDVLGARFHLGRGFLPEEDDDLGAHPVAVLSHELWRHAFGGDPAVLGRSFELDGQPMTVVGVLESGFDYADQELWLPLSMGGRFFGQRFYESRRSRFHYGLVRLPESGGLEMASAEERIDRVMAELEAEHPVEQGDRGAELVDLRTFFFGNVEAPVRLLFAGAVVVLLLCTVNVGALVLSRALARRRELAVRVAVGASRRQVALRLVLEGLLLSLAGGVLGLVAAHGALGNLANLADFGLPSFTRLELDRGVLLLTLLTTVSVGVVLGALPALSQSLRDPATALRAGRPGGVDRQVRARRAWIVALETSVAVVLLVGAALLGKSLLQLRTADLGFETSGLLTARLHLRGEQFQAEEWEDRVAKRHLMAAAADEALEALPGVRSATVWGPSMLGSASRHIVLTPGGLDPAVEENQLFCQFLAIDGGGLRELGIELSQGREFDNRDRSGGRRVAVIDESLAHAAFGTSDVIGRKLHYGVEPDRVVTVVGVTRNTRHRGARSDDAADGVAGDIYLPFSQWATDLPVLALRLEPGVRQDAVVESVRRAVAAIDGAVPVGDFATLDQRLDRNAAVPRLSASLMTIYALITAVLAIVGTYGLLAHAVRERRREIAVRTALGADQGSIERLMLRLGLRPVLLGTAFGLAAAAALSSLLDSMLFEVSRTDPALYAAAAAVVLLAAGTAALLPAQRASRTEPATVLRED